MENGEIDCGILALPLPVQENHLESAKLFDEPFYLAVSRNHHLSKNKTVTFSDLHNVEMLLLDEGHCLREQTLEVCHKIGIGESQNFRATSLETLRQMVASGSAATMIPKLAVRSDRQIAYIPFKKPTPVRTIGLVWRKTSARSKLFHRINELIIGSVNI